jgi:ParB-like chromosome segregation protein Spo0J
MATTVEPQLLNSLLRIPLHLLDPGPNVRANLAGIDELATSISRLGMQKPLLVIDTGNGRYRILDGHRRHAAARRLRLDHVDAILRREAPDVVRIQQQLAIQAQTEGFAAIGRSPAWVRDRISLVHLTDDEKRAVAAGRMPIAQALSVLASRRAERDGRPTPADRPRTVQVRQHCSTCSCRDGAR